MAQSAEMTYGPDPLWKGTYKAGGISFVLAGILGILSFITFLTSPNTFGLSGEATLKTIAANRTSYVVSNAIFLVAGILLVPGVLALYMALKDVHRNYALLGAGILLFSLTNLVLSTSAGALLALSDKYAAAATDAQRALYSAAAEAIQASGNTISAGPLMGGVGFILLGVAMRKGVFHQAIAYLGVATGLAILLAGIPNLGFFFVIFFVLLIVWTIATGFKLYKLG